MLDEHLGDRQGAVAVVGPVGVGKSRLLTGWLSALDAQSRASIVVRATRSTATIPFGAFAPWVPEQMGTSLDRLEALQTTAAHFAEQDPRLVVAVDDAQLLDESSAALVLQLVQHTSLSIVVTVRSGEPCPDAIVALWKEGLGSRVDLTPLSERQTAEVLEQVLGGVVAPATRRRLWQLAQGNPFYLRELIEAGHAQGALTRTAGEWRWKGSIPARSRLVDLVTDRIGNNGLAERRVLELVALGEPLPVEMLASLASEDLLVDVERRGLVVVDRGSEAADVDQRSLVGPEDHCDRRPGTGSPIDVVRLAHPLYSEVLRAELPPFTAKSHHRDLADAAITAGFDQHDPLRVATWLLGSGEASTQPDLLLRSSFLAQNIDDFELSARLAEAAEEASGTWRATLRRAEALGALRRWDEADGLLLALSGPGSEPEAHAAAARVRAQQAFFHRGEDLEVARGIIADAARQIPAPARSHLLTYGARLAVHALELEETIRLASDAIADADSVTDRLRGVTCAGFAAVFLGRTTAATVIAELALPQTGKALGVGPTPATYAAYTYSFALILAGRVDEAASFFGRLRGQDVVPVCGPERLLPNFWLARAALTQGRVRTGTRLCQEVLGLLGDENHFGRGTWVTATLATTAAQAGERSVATEALAWADAHAEGRAESDNVFLDLARAWVRAAEGELSPARDLAVGTARRAGGFGAWTLEMLAWLDAVRLGAAKAAAPRLDELTRLVEGPYAGAAARFARAAADRDGAGLDRVAAVFESMGVRLTAAEASVEAAQAHEAQGNSRQHAASLANAQRLVAMCENPATPLVARLHQQPVLATLTAREREVSDLAARGRTSREIAETLFVSVRTVDSHLNHAYTKLGISGRSELAEVLGRDVERDTS